MIVFAANTIGPLHDPVTWYVINYAGTQVTQWDLQNKGKWGWTGTSSFVLEVPLCNLRPSIIYSVPCDRIVQRAYCVVAVVSDTHLWLWGKERFNRKTTEGDFQIMIPKSTSRSYGVQQTSLNKQNNGEQKYLMN